MEIYRNIQTFIFKVHSECSSYGSRNGAVQIFFSDTKQKHVCWKICKVNKALAALWEHFIFIVKLVEVHKKS